MAEDEDEVSFLWSGIPNQHRNVPLVTLDSPPYSPPENHIITKPPLIVPCEPQISTGFANIDMTTFVPMEHLITPEGSDTQEPVADAPILVKKKKRPRKKKKKNALLVSKMVEQIKEAGVLERNNLQEEKAQELNVTFIRPKEKWTRYFEADLPQTDSEVVEDHPVTARDIRKAAEKAERLARIEKGKIAKLRRNNRSKRSGRCANCHQHGHMKFECPDPIRVMKCEMCAGVGHREDFCPSTMCLLCGARTNEYQSGCRNCRFMYKLRCTRCNSIGHESDFCPDLWRRFYATVDGDGNTVNKSTATGRNSLKPSHKLFCCVCATRGHSVDNCSRAPQGTRFCGPSYVSSLLPVEDFNSNGKQRNNSKFHESVQVMKRFKRDLRY